MIDSLLYWRWSKKLILRQALVVVGGDFARSPRMQYHASSLAKSGLFDEILLVGLDCNNKLSETLLKSGVASKLQLTVSVDAAAAVDNLASDNRKCFPYCVDVGQDENKVTFKLQFTQAETNTNSPHDSNAKSNFSDVIKNSSLGKGEDEESYYYDKG